MAVSFCILYTIPVTSMAAGAGGQETVMLFAKENKEGLATNQQMSYDEVAISQVSNYVNVRAEANTTSSIVGKIYNNCAAKIINTVDGEDGKWYEIESGNVTGYIKAQYFITGDEAETLAKKVGTEFARIKNATTLRLREKPSLDSKTLTLLAEGAEYIVEEEEEAFAKISVDTDLTGYVSKDYIETWVVFDTAVTLEEEEKKKEEADKLKQEADEAIKQLEEVKQAQAGSQEQQGQQPTQEQQLQKPEEEQDLSNNQSMNVPTGGNASSSGSDLIEANPLGQNNSSSTGQPGVPSLGAGENEETPSKDTEANSGTQIPSPGSGTENAGQGSSNIISGNGPAGGSNNSGSSNSNPSGNKEVETATRTAIVAYAKQFLGNPYVYGGTSLTNGADCSGFVQSIFKHFGITTGRSSRDQAANGKTIAVKDAQPGDLLFYASGDYINHVAIYIGGNQVIHASNSRTGIIISPANYRTPCKAVTFLD